MINQVEVFKIKNFSYPLAFIKDKELRKQKVLKLQDNMLKGKFVLNYLAHRCSAKNLRSTSGTEVIKFVGF